MPPRKVIAVVGATGAQGGGLVRAILNDASGEFAARAITRDAASPKARQLAEAGADVVTADVNDVDSLERVFDGAYGAYCVTFFWQHMSAQREMGEAANLARAAKDAGVEHAIWSTLEDTRRWIPLSDTRMPTLQEKYKVPHFDVKGEANRFFLDEGVPVTLLHTAFYWDNFIYFGAGPKPGADGVLTLTLPMGDKRLPGIAAEDIGKCALGIFKADAEFIGKSIGIVGESLTGAQMAAAMSRAFGREVRYKDVPPDVYRSFGFPGADEMGNMYQFKRDFESAYVGGRSVELSRRLNPQLQSFDQWLDANKDRIPIEAAEPATTNSGS